MQWETIVFINFFSLCVSDLPYVHMLKFDVVDVFDLLCVFQGK